MFRWQNVIGFYKNCKVVVCACCCNNFYIHNLTSSDRSLNGSSNHVKNISLFHCTKNGFESPFKLWCNEYQSFCPWDRDSKGDEYVTLCLSEPAWQHRIDYCDKTERLPKTILNFDKKQLNSFLLVCKVTRHVYLINLKALLFNRSTMISYQHLLASNRLQT